MQELRKVGQEYKLIRYEFNKEIVIPVNSALMKLTEICDILDAQRIPIEESERKKRKGNFPYYGASGIIDYIDDFIFNEKLLCLAEDGENLRSRVLPVAFIIEGKTWVNNHAHVLKPKANVTDVKYLEYFLNHKRYEKYLSFTAQPKLTQEEMKKILVILPPLIEQRKIASILSKVDQLIEKTDQIIEQTQRLKKGLMQKLLTQGVGHSRFMNTSIGQIPEEWELQQLSAIAELTMGQSPPGDSYNFNHLGAPLLNGPTEFGIEHPIPVQFTTVPTKLSQKGDVLLCVRGSTTGRLNLADQEYCLGRGLASIRGLKSKADAKWLYYQFLRLQNKIYNIASGGGTTFPNINSDSIKKLLIPYPPFEEQQKISQILYKMDSYINKQQNMKVKLGLLKKGLMQKLLTGKVRVKV